MVRELLIQDVSRGQQSLFLKETWQLGEHRVKVSRKRDCYDFQSYATISRWNGEKWHQIDSIPYKLMARGRNDSPYAAQETPRKITEAEIKDRDELLRRAVVILGVE